MLSIGGRTEGVGVPEVKLQAHKEPKAADWELAIHEAREDTVRVFTDETMDERGDVGAGWYVKAEMGKGGKEAAEGRERFGCKVGLGMAVRCGTAKLWG